MNYAHIKDGKVHNVIEAEADFASKLGAEFVLMPEGFGIGDEYDGAMFKKPEPPVVPAPTKAELILRERVGHKALVIEAFLDHEGPALDAELKKIKKAFEDKKKAIEG